MPGKFTLKTVFLLLLTFSIFLQPYSIATIRYVSHTGSSTPPYTSWETAADSIQKCINYSVNGDTIIVANGVYYESLVVNKQIFLTGLSADSTVIDGTALENITVYFQTNTRIQNFMIKGRGEGIANTECIRANNTFIKDCRMINADIGIGAVFTSPLIDKCVIADVRRGCFTASIDTYKTTVTNSIIIIDGGSGFPTGISIFDGGELISLENIIIGNNNPWGGIGIDFDVNTNTIKNNIVLGFYENIEGNATDTALVHNNISSYAGERGITINTKTDMRNNIVAYNKVGTVGPTNTNSDYNLYWQNTTHTGIEGLAVNDIVADPMFVNDTIPIYGGTYDYHLQAYSPAIGRGDPNILDVDGSRSDIGVYGGPGGEMYTYIDLPPRPPVNVNASVDSSIITVKWNKNTEADTSHYNVYRDTVANFTIEPTKLISSQTDTIYIQPVPTNIESLYYKITAVDTQGNESLPSEEVGVLITSVDDYQVVIEDYILYQNYPNPFNPGTKIGYKLKERGYVKLMVYDIKGELISVLVNQVQEAGYYEVEFNGRNLTRLPDGQVNQIHTNDVASGIYLYRLEVIGEGNIPRFSDMKKMILIK